MRSAASKHGCMKIMRNWEGDREPKGLLRLKVKIDCLYARELNLGDNDALGDVFCGVWTR
jgi:hypothetical protein